MKTLNILSPDSNEDRFISRMRCEHMGEGFGDGNEFGRSDFASVGNGRGYGVPTHRTVMIAFRGDGHSEELRRPYIIE
jgi:hypothetical protein